MNGGLRPELAAELARRYPGACVETLPADASTRQFHRLFLTDGTTRVVMDYGKPFVGETDDVHLARIFERADLPVARVLEVLPAGGALILEDLGDDTLERALDSAGMFPRRRQLYRSAVGLAAAIATRGTTALADSERSAGPALDAERFLFEMRFFLEHYVGSFLGRADVADRLREPLEALAVATAEHPRVLCHRDFHSRNIMVRADESLAMVDIQDARWGPDTYDLASLLWDAYVDLGDRERAELFEVYVGLFDSTDDSSPILARFNLVSAQRMFKALGTFGYQIAVLGRERYRSAIPRTTLRLVRLLPNVTQIRRLADALFESEILTR